jgi:hypothetical protein
MEDVPAASTFTVEDTLLVHQVEDEEGKVSVQVEMSHWIIFSARTMYKYLIEVNTHREVKLFMEKYFEYMQSGARSGTGRGKRKSSLREKSVSLGSASATASDTSSSTDQMS